MKILNENVSKNIMKNLKEETNYYNSEEMYNMNMSEMINKCAEMCEEAQITYRDLLEQLESYGCLNTGSFRDMLKDTMDYLNNNY